MNRRSLLIGAAIVGFVVLNVAGLVTIASGSASLGRIGSTPGSGAEVQPNDPRYGELVGDSSGSREPDLPESTVPGSTPVVNEPPAPREPENDTLGLAPQSPGEVALVGPGGGKGSEDAGKARRLLDLARLDLREAGRLGLEQVGGRLVEVKLDDESGGPVYEVEVYGEDGNLHEFEVDGYSGRVFEKEIKSKKDSEEALFLLRSVTIDQETLQQSVAEVAPGELTKLELKSHESAVVFEVETLDGPTLYKLRVDARSGDVVSYEVKGNAGNVVTSPRP